MGAWLAYDSGYANTASGYARRGFDYPDLGARLWAPEFVAEAHRQSAAIAASEHEADDQAFVDAISVDWATAEGESAE